MSGDEQRGLRRLDDIENKVLAGLQDLPEEERRDVIRKLHEQDIEVRGEILRKYGASQLAEHDIAVALDAVQRLDHERKIYSEHHKGETGSGSYDLHIRGGDTKFIIPVLVVAGIVILGIVLILALTWG